jgi:homoserine kinase type II
VVCLLQEEPTVESNEDELLRAVLQEHYDLGELVDCEKLLLGYVNVSYVVELRAGGELKRFFVRRYKRGIEAEEIEFEHSVIHHLVEHRFELVARVLPTRNGKSYVMLEEGDGPEPVYYAVFDYLTGEDRYTWVNPRCQGWELEGAASVLARFHSAVFDLSPAGVRHEPKIMDLLPRIADHIQVYARRAGETEFDAYYLEHLDYALDAIRRTLDALHETGIRDLVQQVIHCDYHPGNLKFQGKEITGLFDFDWSKVDARCFDVALALFYFCTSWEGPRAGELRLDEVSAFLAAYQDGLRGTHRAGPLNEVELAALPHMINASSIYVLTWTLIDFYRKQVDPGEYLIYLRHSVRLIKWLEDEHNWERLVDVIAGSGARR